MVQGLRTLSKEDTQWPTGKWIKPQHHSPENTNQTHDDVITSHKWD